MDIQESGSYKAILQAAPIGYALHTVLFDKQGNPIDYVFDEINAAFLALTGLTGKVVTGKPISVVIPEIFADPFCWVAFYGSLSMEGGTKAFEQYSQALDRWYKVTAFSSGDGSFTTVFIDISSEKEQARLLAQSEQRYIGILESQHDMVVRVDSKNRFTYVNDAYCRAFGKSKDELLGQTFTPLVHEDDLEATLEEMKNLSVPPHRATIVQRAKTVTGWRWLQWEDSAILDGDGLIVEVQGVGRDITEMKQREEALVAYQKQLQLAQQLTGTGTWAYDLADGRLAWSPECEKIFGIPSGSFEGTFEAFLDRVHPEDKEYVLDVNRPITELKEGKTLSYEHRIVHEDGSVRWVKEAAGVVYDSAGIPIQVMGFVSDITEEKRVAGILENEEKLRQIINNIDGVFWLRSADLQEVLYVNPAYEKIFGRSADNLFSNPSSFSDAIHPDDRDNALKAIASYNDTGNYSQVYRILRPDGEIRWIHSKAFAVRDERGTVVRHACIANDITESKRMQDAYKGELAFREFLFNVNRDGQAIINNDHKVVEANAAFCANLGYTLEEMLELHTWHFDALQSEQDIVEGFDTTGEVDTTFQSRHRRKDGTEYDVEISARSFLWEGERMVLCTCRDVTERLQMLKGIREARELAEINQRRFEEIAAFTGEFIWEIDRNGVYTYSNGVVEDLLGYKPEEMIGKSCLSFLDEDNRSELEPLISDIVRSGKPIVNIENVMMGSDGRKVHMITNGIPIFGPEGELLGYRGSDRNITERVEAERKLSESEMRFRNLVENINDVIFTLNGEGVIQYISPVIESMTGFAPSEYIGKSFASFIHPDDLQRISEEFQQIKLGILIPSDYRINSKTGAEVWIRSSTRPVVQPNGEVFYNGVAKNISETKKADLELRVSEERYRKLFNENLDSISIFYLEDEGSVSPFIDMNPSAEALIGYGREELMGIKISDIEEPYTPEDARRNFESLVTNGAAKFETRVRKKGGELIDIEVKAVLITYNNRQAIMNISRDITEQKRAEEMLRKSEEQYRIVADNTYNWEFWESPDHIFLYHSPACKEITGYSPEELMENIDLFVNMIHPDDKPVFLDHHAKKGSLCDRRNLYFRIEMPEGATKYIEHLCRPVYDRDGNYLGIRGTHVDITARIKAHEQLIESELFANAVILSTPALMFIFDIENQELVWFNEEYVQFFSRNAKGRSTDFSSGLKQHIIIDWVHPEEKNILIERSAQLANDPTMHRVELELRVQDADGWKWMRLILSLFKEDKQGKSKQLFGALFNIDSMKRNEQELVEARIQAEENNRLKSAFLATISHELRTPLNHIMGLSDLISDVTPDPDSREYATIIHRSSHHLSGMIQDIFDLALAEQAGITLRKTTVTGMEIYVEAKSTLQRILSGAGKGDAISLQFKPEPTLLETYLTIDISKVLQVLTNLFRNAVKFTSSGIIEFGFQLNLQNDLVLYVKDTGIGIPTEKFDVIFDFFRQVDDSHTRQHEGVGIGLAISKRIADAMGATLSMTSVIGEGSTFTFQVPLEHHGLDRGEDQAVTDRIIEAPNLTGKKIILAEDDEISMNLFVKLLADSNATVLTAENGEQAIELYHNHRDVDLVLLDIKMPGIDGLTACRIMKSHGCSVPIVALTAYALPAQKELAYSAGFKSVITKPVMKKLFYAELERCLL
jgi:PAS domain S-box-containing protein